jgi:phage baseplate assembly protein gpV
MGAFLSPPADVRQPVVIYNDSGGIVIDYEKAAARYRLEGRKVEIRGSCRSACILALSVPTVCVSPGAIVKAHHAYEVGTRTPRVDVTERMLGELPPKISQRLSGKVDVNYNTSATLTYTQLVSLGVASCDKRATVASDRPVQVKLMDPFGGIKKWLGFK